MCLFCRKYDDDVATIPPNLVCESIWSSFSVAVLSGSCFFQLPNRSWVTPSPLSHPDSLECWYLRHETALSVSAWGDLTWGISGRYLVSDDATCTGLA